MERTPEENARLRAETEKLEAEAQSLRKSGWAKPSSWIPMLAAIAAVGTSLGQCQLAQIDEREAALDAREKVLEAKVEEDRLKEANEELERRNEEVTQEIARSTQDLRDLQSQIKEENTQLLALARQQEDAQVVARLEDNVRQQNERLATVVESAERRSEGAQLRNLVWQMNSNDKSTRLAAVKTLIDGHGADPSAIRAALDLLAMPQLESLSPSGRINVLVYLRNTVDSAWTKDMVERGFAALELIARREKEGKAYIGTQTKAELRKLNDFLVAAS